MKKLSLALFFLFFAISCEPAYTQITFDKILNIRNDFYLSDSYKALDSSNFTLNEVYFTYATGWTESTKYWNQKFNIRYYPSI